MHAVALMQPYLFPYLGTYQLACASDQYVFFDAVAFMKTGFINRNATLSQGKALPFTISVRDVSIHRHILAHQYAGQWSAWLKRLALDYRKAPFFDPVYALVESVALDPDENVARKNALSMTRVFQYLELPRKWQVASEIELDPALRGAERVVGICRALGATDYVNASGGRALYEPEMFRRYGMKLWFLHSEPEAYLQTGGGAFVPHLSMIDVLMHNSIPDVRRLLTQYRLLP